MTGIRRRLKLQSNGPRGLALVGATAYAQYCRTHSLPPMPVVAMNSAICRADLLFELEVDAVRTKS